MKQLEYYYGRPLKGVELGEDGSWTILLEGDVRIKNHDTSLRQPDIPAEKYNQIVFSVTILEESKTQLVFRPADPHVFEEWRIVLNPMQYSIIHDGEEYFPQHPVERQSHPTPPEPTDRIAEGPTKTENDT